VISRYRWHFTRYFW